MVRRRAFMNKFKNDCFRELQKAKKRLLALAFLFLLGTSLFIGGQAIYPTMLKTGDRYYQSYHLPDATIKSTAGFTSDDFSTIQEQVKLANHYLGYSEFAISDYKQQVALIRSMPKSNAQQKNAPYQLKQGSFPQKSGEIVLDQKMATIYPLGSNITFLDDLNHNTQNQLKKTTFQVVGFVSSPEFIHTQFRGISPIGNGEIAFISVILEQDFNLSTKNDLILTYQTTKNKTHYQTPYQQELSKQARQTRTALNQIGIQKMEEAKEALLTKQADIEEKIADLTAELDNQTTEISDSEKIVSEQKIALEAEKSALSQQLTTIESELTGAQATFQQNEQLLTAKIQEVETMTTAIEESETLMAENQNSLDEFTQLVEANQEQVAALQDSLDADAKKIKQIQHPAQQKEAQKKYESRLKNYQTQQAKIAAQLNQLATSQTQFTANEAILAQQNETLTTALDQLSQLEERFSDSESDYETKLFEKEDIQQTQNELATTDSEMVAADEQSLAELKETLAQQKTVLETEIKKETKDKHNVSKQIKQVKAPAFSIEKATENSSYAAYQKELLHLKYVTQIAPVIVYGLTMFVAASLIFNSLRKNQPHFATLKALGVPPFPIFAPTLLLNTSAALIGLVAGCFIGIYGIPMVVFKLYQKSYLIENAQFLLNKQVLAVAFGLTLLINLLPVLYDSLIITHKQTKAIKQIQHLTVSVVVPITIAVTLLFLGINSLVTIQTNELKEHPTILEVKLHPIKEQTDKPDYLKLLHYYSIEAPPLVHKEDITLTNGSSISLIVPKEKSDLANLLPTKGALLTEKTAKNQRLKRGDSVVAYDAKGQKQVLLIEKILKIEQEGCYLSSAYYQEVFKKESTADTFQLELPTTLNQVIGTPLLDVDTLDFKGKLYERLENPTSVSTPAEATSRLATLLLGLPTVDAVSQTNAALSNDSLRTLVSVFVLITICITALTIYAIFYHQLASQTNYRQILSALGFEKQKIHASILNKCYPFIMIGCFLGGIFGMTLYTFLSKKIRLNLPISFSIMNYSWTLLIVFLLSLTVITFLNNDSFNLTKLRRTIHDFFLNFL